MAKLELTKPVDIATEPRRLSDLEMDAVAGGLFNLNSGNVGNQQVGLVPINAGSLNIGNVSIL